MKLRYPKTYFIASAALTLEARRPMTRATSASPSKTVAGTSGSNQGVAVADDRVGRLVKSVERRGLALSPSSR